jgi:hypothetical protein
MPDDISPERITVIAAAARLPLRPDAPARIAGAVAPVITRFAAENIAMPMETEPSTFVAVQHKDAKR